MNEVGQGEVLCQDGTFYDKTVPKPVIDILAEMIALDPTISVGPFGAGSGPGSSAGIDD